MLILFSTLALFWTLAFLGAGINAWIIAVSTILLSIQFSYEPGLWVSIFMWGPVIAIFSIIKHRPWRRRLFTAPLFKQFRKVMPPMSQTEKEALEAGSVWWDAELFSGAPDWDYLLKTQKPKLSSEEQSFIDGPVEKLCDLLDDWKITHEDADLSPAAWDYIKKQGFFGLIIPKQYGGKAYSAYAHSEVVMKIASRSIAAAVTVMVPNSLGPGKLLLHYGTKEQKNYYLPRLANGQEIPCFALTGPEAGSDAGAIPDNGVVCYGSWQGEDNVLGIRLNWQKRYITLGPICTLLGLAFKLYDPDHLLGDKESLGITLALIPRDTQGVHIGDRHVTLNVPFQNGPNTGRDVFIPMNQLIGGTEFIGKGWRMLVECLAEGRGISLPSLSTGAGKMAARYTGAYAALRRQFNTSIGQFEGVEKPLARIAGLTYQMDATRNLTLSAIDAGHNPSVISAIVKYHLTEKYRECINDAMDIQGGSGICLGPSNLIGRAYQAIPIAITVEGANILTRNMIIFGQGAIRCHPWILKELEAVQNPDRKRGLVDFDRAIFGHAVFLMRNVARTFFLGLTRGKLLSSPSQGPSKTYFQQLQWMSAGFALTSDVAMMTLGGALKRKERLSARLGDILSELYLTSAVLKQFVDDGEPESDIPLVKWCADNALYRMQECYRLLFRNIPIRPIAWALRWLIFPSGRPYTEPSDKIDHLAAQLILKPSNTRDRLTRGIFKPTDDSRFPQARLEVALQQLEKVKPIETTIREAKRSGLLETKNLDDQIIEARAQGIISQSDVDELQLMQELRRKVIQVDSFPNYGRQFELENRYSLNINYVSVLDISATEIAS